MSKYVDQIEKIVEETAQQSSPSSSYRMTPEPLGGMEMRGKHELERQRKQKKKRKSQ